MNLETMPEEMRKLFEDAGLMAEATTNNRIELAMQGLQHAIAADWNRLKSASAQFADDQVLSAHLPTQPARIEQKRT